MKETQNNTWQHGLFIGGLVLFFILGSMYAFPRTWGSASLFPEREFKLGLDLQGGAHLVYDADMDLIPEEDRNEALEGVRDVIERRVNAFGVSEPLVQTNRSGDTHRVIVELAGVFDIREAIASIGETPILQFKLPVPPEDINPELTAEQEQQITDAQEEEREAALDVLARARDGEDFDALAREFSIDSTTKDSGGYIGFIDDSHPVFDGLAEEIADNRYRPGIIPGLYESTSAIHVIDYRGENAIEEAELSHILICHDESERCEATRSKEEARALAEELAGEVTPISFADVAQDNSDDLSNASSGGSLGWVREGMMVPPFEEAYLALDDGEISDVVETQFGFHIIFREDTREVSEYEIAHIEMPWTTASDIVNVDPWMNTDLSGKDIRRATVAFDPNTNEPIISLDFNQEGGELFAQITEENTGQILGIFLDGFPISTPQIIQPIYGGSATITGQFTVIEARDLARNLNAGALPVPVQLVGQQTVGPTLGAISLERSINAALIGFALVALFMALYYRLAGLVSVVALIAYALMNLIAYKLFGITMTLSGIAGFILSLGMAVDANVLIFERLKEELAAGRTFSTAVHEGFRRAWTSIRDGNATTLVASFILFVFSTSFIKGFALTLGIGIMLSMFTAIIITRLLLQIIGRFEALTDVRLYGVKKK